MNTFLVFVLMFSVVTQIQGRWLKRWGKYGKRGLSIGVNSVTLGLQGEMVRNARTGEFLLLPSNYKKLKTSVDALLEQNEYQEALETKIIAEEKNLRIANIILSVLIGVMLVCILVIRSKMIRNAFYACFCNNIL